MTYIEISYSEALKLKKELIGGFKSPDGSFLKVWQLIASPHLLIEFKDKCYKASYISEINDIMQELLNPLEDDNAKNADNTGDGTEG